MYYIAICDDDPNYIAKIKNMVLECSNLEDEIVFLEYASGEELLDTMPNTVDILFLDIQMDGVNGNEVAVRLRRVNFRGLLVLCSGIYAPTPETIVISPYRYLQKQEQCEETMKTVREVLNEMVRRRSFSALLAERGAENFFIRVDDIVYISRTRRGSEIHLKNEKKGDKRMLCKTPFDELRANLRPAGFAFAHNSYIVNLRYLTSISKTGETIRLGNLILTLARSKKNGFIEDAIAYANGKYGGDIHEI